MSSFLKKLLSKIYNTTVVYATASSGGKSPARHPDDPGWYLECKNLYLLGLATNVLWKVCKAVGPQVNL